MISYTKRYVNIVSLTVTILLYIFLIKVNLLPQINNFEKDIFSNIFKKNTILVELSSNNINQETKEDLEIQNKSSINETEENSQTETKESNWKIKIPKISLEASISEGTRKQVMDKSVGHFEETSKKSGNNNEATKKVSVE